MRRYIPALLLALTAFAPFSLGGCDLINKLRGGGEAADAAAEAAVVEAVVDAAPVAQEPVDAAAPTLPKTAAVVKKVDGGADASVDAAIVVDAATPAVVDASAVIADAGAQLADAAARLFLSRDGGKLTLPRGLIKKN